MSTLRAAVVVLAISVTLCACASSASRGIANVIATPDVTGDLELFPVRRSVTTHPSLCDFEGGPDSTVYYQEAVTGSRFVRSVELRLPPLYEALRLLIPPPTPRHEDHGRIWIATWTQSEWDVSVAKQAPGMSIWVGPESGIPMVGAERFTEQTAYAECTGWTIAGHPARVAVFTLRLGRTPANMIDAAFGENEHRSFLAAVWPAPRGRYMQLIASAPDPERLAPFRRALLDARVTGP